MNPTSAATATAQMLLSAVIISRNEAAHIESCLQSVVSCASCLDCHDIVLVDSCSTDETVARARRFPINVACLNEAEPRSAALGRLVGQLLTSGRYILFVDGDSVINRDWVEAAVQFLERHPDVAGVGGKLHEIYYRHGVAVAENPDFFAMGDTVEDAYQLGGNAIYRREALDAVGSFHPFIIAGEEAELASRLRKAGYHLVRLPITVATHHTLLRGTLAELWRRFRGHLMTGYGQVLRVSLRDGLFWTHVPFLNRYLLTLVFLFVGVAAATASVIEQRPRFLVAWLGAALGLVLLFVARSRTLTVPFAVIMDWLLSAPAILWGFFRTPLSRERFSLERAVASINGQPCNGRALTAIPLRMPLQSENRVSANA